MRQATWLAAAATLVCLSAAVAHAQGQAPRARFSLSGGLIAPSSSQSDGVLAVNVKASPSPTQLRLAAEYFPLSWLGASVDLSGQWFSVTGNSVTGTTNPKISMSGYNLLPSLAARWSPSGWLTLQGQLGYGVGAIPALDARQTTVTRASVAHHGPALSVLADLEPSRYFGARVWLTAAPFSAHATLLGTPIRLWWLSVGTQLSFGRLEAFGLRGAIVIDYELMHAQGGSDSPLLEYSATQHRLGLGLQVVLPAVGAATTRPEASTGRIVGVVRTADGKGAASAVVEVPDREKTRADAQGRFTLSQLRPGPAEVRAALSGFKPATADCVVIAGEDVTLALTLQRPSGPGIIRGTVTTGEEKAPVEGAEVSAGQGHTARTSAAGFFTLDKVGPGPVPLTVTAKGFAAAEEVVQVPAEAEASVEFSLRTEGARPLATLRGLIRSTTGQPVKATVRVVELNAKAAVKADGRFVMQVPGGKYTVNIEAPGFLGQSKTVEVADGDQALFHVELQPVR